MSKINQKEWINVNFSNEPGIFDECFGYPEEDKQEKYNRPISKVTVLVEASQKGWQGLSVERLRQVGIVHVPQVG